MAKGKENGAAGAGKKLGWSKDLVKPGAIFKTPQDNFVIVNDTNLYSPLVEVFIPKMNKKFTVPPHAFDKAEYLGTVNEEKNEMLALLYAPSKVY